MARNVVLLILFAAAFPAPAVAQYSVIELQARSNIVDGFNLPASSSFNSKTPALNDSATIAFTLITVGSGNPGLFVGSGGNGSVVYSGPAGRVLSDPSINAGGAVVFDQSDIQSEGIFVFDPVEMETTLTVPATSFAYAAGTDLGDDGAIGFRASQTNGSRSWQLHDEGASTTFASHGGNIAYLFVPSTNNLHEIAGKVRLDHTGGTAPDEIRVYDGPDSFSVVAEDVNAEPGSPYSSFDNSVSLVDDGRVAFIADTVTGDRGVYLTDGTTTTTIASVADPQVSGISFFAPTANSAGLVVFRGTDEAGLDAIFVGDGVQLLRVIGEHDLVQTDLGTARIDQHDGSVVFGGGVGINANGDIAFNAALTPEDDNQIEWGSGMFIALADSSPPPVPDGKLAGLPMRVAQSAFGSLAIHWDTTTCPAPQYNLFYGDLALVATGEIVAARCDLGNTGLALFNPPVSDIFFLLASENAAGVESGHGLDGAGDPRPFTGAGFCDIVEQSLEGVCR